jgi:hypothetical protein
MNVACNQIGMQFRFLNLTVTIRTDRPAFAVNYIHSTSLQYLLKQLSVSLTLNPLGTIATIWPIVPGPGDDYECGAVGGMIDSGNRENLP